MNGGRTVLFPGPAADAEGFVVFDIETTGMRRSDRIVEFAAELLDLDGITVGSYNTLVDPGRRGVTAQRIHGITKSMLIDAPQFEDVAGDVADLLRDRVAVAHHLSFDWGHLRDELRRVGVDAPSTVPGICTAQLARVAGGDSARLSAVCARLGIVHSTPHVAAADAQATVGVLKALGRHLPRLPSYRPCPSFRGVWRLPPSAPPLPRSYVREVRVGDAEEVADVPL